ncbi:MAG: hypothetical protein GF350_00475 [Chitinivibrionales bacterium]|nr:hypothetical protein [Chitinivibrionales bacterium]
MRKLLALLIVLSILIPVIGCDGGEVTPTPTETPTPTSEPPGAWWPITGPDRNYHAATIIVAASNSKYQNAAHYRCDGTADDDTVQSAVDSLGTSPGVVLLLDGSYSATGNVTVSNAGQFIKGLGWATTWNLSQSANTTDYAFVFSGNNTYNCGISDMIIDCNGANQTAGGGVYVEGMRQFRIDNLKAQEGKVYNVYVKGNTLSCNGFRMFNSELTGAGTDNLRVQAVWNWKVYDTYMQTATQKGLNTSGGGECLVHGCSFDTNTQAGAYFYAVSRGTIADTRYCGDNGRAGIEFASTCLDMTVNGGEVNDNGSSGTNPYGVYVKGTANNTQVYNITAHNNDTVHQDYGVYIGATAVNTVVKNNGLSYNTVAGVYNGNSTSIIRYNKGYVTENSGTATIANGSTSIVVTHGLATTPTDVTLTPKEQGTNDYGRLSWGSGNSTRFTITCSADPGASNLDVNWYAFID